jgi:hypothetical protein
LSFQLLLHFDELFEFEAFTLLLLTASSFLLTSFLFGPESF